MNLAKLLFTPKNLSKLSRILGWVGFTGSILGGLGTALTFLSEYLDHANVANKIVEEFGPDIAKMVVEMMAKEATK